MNITSFDVQKGADPDNGRFVHVTWRLLRVSDNRVICAAFYHQTIFLPQHFPANRLAVSSSCIYFIPLRYLAYFDTT